MHKLTLHYEDCIVENRNSTLDKDVFAIRILNNENKEKAWPMWYEKK